MEWFQNIFSISEATRQWWSAHGVTVLLMIFVFAQWIGLQAFAIHYHFFRKSLNRPKPDQVRFSLIEKTMALQQEQLDRIYSKMAELNKDLNETAARVKTPVQRVKEPTVSLESTYASIGELNLKKRIQEISKAIN
jgi:hypothetical protein